MECPIPQVIIHPFLIVIIGRTNQGKISTTSWGMRPYITQLLFIDFGEWVTQCLACPIPRIG